MIRVPIFAGEHGSKERFAAVHKWLFKHFGYRTDQEQYGKPEEWTGALEQLIESGLIKDDCDGYGSALLQVMVYSGSISPYKCAELMIDAEKRDGVADHYAAGFQDNDGKWWVAHNWHDGLQSVKDYELGVGRIVKHRPMMKRQFITGAPMAYNS